MERSHDSLTSVVNLSSDGLGNSFNGYSGSEDPKIDYVAELNCDDNYEVAAQDDDSEFDTQDSDEDADRNQDTDCENDDNDSDIQLDAKDTHWNDESDITDTDSDMDTNNNLPVYSCTAILNKNVLFNILLRNECENVCQDVPYRIDT